VGGWKQVKGVAILPAGGQWARRKNEGRLEGLAKKKDVKGSTALKGVKNWGFWPFRLERREFRSQHNRGGEDGRS